MNYIQKLTEENKELQTKLWDIQEEITNKMVYLSSEKFSWPENNYVNAREMFQFLVELRMKTI